MFRHLQDDYDEEKDDPAHTTAVSVAVKQYPIKEGVNKTGHGGRLCWCGDINAETSSLLMRFLASEGLNLDGPGVSPE